MWWHLSHFSTHLTRSCLGFRQTSLASDVDTISIGLFCNVNLDDFPKLSKRLRYAERSQGTVFASFPEWRSLITATGSMIVLIIPSAMMLIGTHSTPGISTHLTRDRSSNSNLTRLVFAIELTPAEESDHAGLDQSPSRPLPRSRQNTHLMQSPLDPADTLIHLTRHAR
jgi:hypothetical protein